MEVSFYLFSKMIVVFVLGGKGGVAYIGLIISILSKIGGNR